MVGETMKVKDDESLESESGTISITRDALSYAEASDRGNEVHNSREQIEKMRQYMLSLIARDFVHPSSRSDDFSEKQQFLEKAEKARRALLKKGFTRDDRSGKKCYMLKAKELSIAWIDNPEYWMWRSVPESSFVCENSTCSKDVPGWEVAELLNVYWFNVIGKLCNSGLSPKTAYVGYLLFKIAEGSCGLDVPVKTYVTFAGKRKATETIYFKSTSTVPEQPRVRLPRQRLDGWMEIEVGEFFNEGDYGQVQFEVIETNVKKRGLIILGIHLRPKENV